MGGDYLLYNNIKDKAGRKSGILDLCDFNSVASVLWDSVELPGIDRQIFLDFALMISSDNPSLRPIDVLKRCKSLISQPVRSLRNTDDLDMVWDFSLANCRKQKPSESLKSEKLAVALKKRLEVLSYLEGVLEIDTSVVEYIDNMMQCFMMPIQALLDTGFLFDEVWDLFWTANKETCFADCDYSQEIIKVLKDRIEAGLFETSSLRNAMIDLRSPDEYKLWYEIKIEAINFRMGEQVKEEFPPYEECPRCAEYSWKYVSMSPNGKSVTWKCSYCKKQIIVKGNSTNDSTDSVSRLGIPREVQREVWRRDGGKCTACGSPERLEYDRIIPVSRGGSNTARNIQLLCEKCNRQKSNSI